MSAAFIYSVFNYCDRWCERCPLTARCRLFAQEQGEAAAQGARDLDNAEFWRSFERNFRDLEETLLEEAKRRGISLTEACLEEEQQKLQDRYAETQRHPLVQGSKVYDRGAREWLTANEPLVSQAVDRLELAERLAAEEGTSPATLLRDAIEVVHYYSFQIQTKLFRALNPADLDGERLDPASDANGSAKVTLIDMDRSIAAWGHLYEQVPAEEDRILDMLLQLDRLRKLTEREFPLARAFVRPGFDGGA